MDAKRIVIFGYLLVVVLGINFTLSAQSMPLVPFVPIDEQLAPNEIDTFEFTMPEGAVISILVQARDTTLDPMVRLLNASGDVVIANDDYDYPNRTDALIEAFTIPQTGTYTIVVEGHHATTGAYRVELFSGYPNIVLIDNFTESTDMVLLGNGEGSVSINAESIEITQEGISQSSLTRHPRANYQDFYLSTLVKAIDSVNSWTVGIVFRLQSETNYYEYQVNNRGAWRFVLVNNGTSEVLRDWTNHPAIPTEATNFQLGILAIGSGFDLFFNNQYIGTVIDNQLPQSGTIGFSITTGNALDSRVTAQFDDLVITTPTLINNQQLIPQQIALGSSTYIARQLQHAGLIPIGGELVLELDESTALYNDDGVSITGLVRGTTFENFVYSAWVASQTNVDGLVGCGLVAHQNGDDYLLAYADNRNGYGLAYKQGQSFITSNFGQLTTTTVQTWLLLVAQDNRAYLYVNGTRVATIEHPSTDGSIGNAVVNYDSVSTTCRFRDVWLWRVTTE